LPGDVDESELEAELAGMEEDMAMEALTEAPSYVSQIPASQPAGDADELQRLEQG
jgi:hypothetical protein